MRVLTCTPNPKISPYSQILCSSQPLFIDSFSVDFLRTSFLVSLLSFLTSVEWLRSSPIFFSTSTFALNLPNLSRAAFAPSLILIQSFRFAPPYHISGMNKSPGPVLSRLQSTILGKAPIYRKKTIHSPTSGAFEARKYRTWLHRINHWVREDAPWRRSGRANSDPYYTIYASEALFSIFQVASSRVRKKLDQRCEATRAK